MTNLAPSIELSTIKLLATPLSRLNLGKYPVLLECLRRTTFSFLYELARKTSKELTVWGFTKEAVQQAGALLRALGLKLGIPLTDAQLLAVQKATHKHSAPRRATSAAGSSP